MKSSIKNKETMISENFEKSLRDWKLPPSSASDIFEPRVSSFSCIIPDCRVKTVEKEILLKKGIATFPLFSKYRQIGHKILTGWNSAFVHVGMIQVGLKPTKLGSNTSAIICLRDKGITKYLDSIRGRVESSLCDGPIYFSYYPTHCVDLSSSCKSFTIDVKIKGSEVGISATLMYRFHYRVVKMPYLMNFHPVDERGQTTLHLTDIAQSNRVVLKTITWDPARKGEGSTVEDEEAGGADVDWKETAEGHVVKVDVPGFKKEEVRVAVEEGGIVQISGERSNEEEEEEGDKLHCKERGKGKFLRRLRLPENADLEGLEARLENGLLTVTVPKKKKKKPEVKIVDISG